MVRTVISLDPEDKRWLDTKAKEENTTMTDVVRRAVRRLREEDEKANLAQLLEATKGIWTEGDGLEYQIRIREEWDRDPL
jgi:hypothetical protein